MTDAAYTTRHHPRRTLATGTKRHESGPYSKVLTIALWGALCYFLVPLAWLVLSTTKTTNDLFSTFGLNIGHHFALWANIRHVFTFENGIFSRWVVNTVLYTASGATGATLLATMCGYALARYRFFGRRAVIVLVRGAVMVPMTAITVPMYLLFSAMGLTNTVWAVILPSFVNPFGVFLVSVYATGAIDGSLLEAARLDGSGEFRTLFQLALPLLAPCVATVFLFSAVACWNNYLLPLVMFSSQSRFPITVGLAQWQSVQIAGPSGSTTTELVLTGSVIAVLPLIGTFVALQRFWVSGLNTGAVKG